jgi:hypothetical protein
MSARGRGRLTATGAPAIRASATLLGRRFYLFMAVLTAAIVAYGFSRTIDRGLIHPSFVVPTILYVHVALFVGWLLLLLVQTGLVQKGRVQLHRALGLGSIGFGLALLVVGVWVAFVMASIETQQGDPQAASFLIVPLADMLFFGVLFCLGVCYRKKPETHRRLMLMAAIGLTGAAFGRFPSFIVPHGWFYPAADMLVFLGVLRDLGVQGRVHRVYLIGLPLLMAAQALTMAVRYSAWWDLTSRSLIQ